MPEPDEVGDGGRRQLPPGLRWFLDNPDLGPFPALLLAMTAGTGVIDSVSILGLGLGRVFVANMTGNVVFSAPALAGALGFSLTASLIALAGFLVGASAGVASSMRPARSGAVCSAASPSSRPRWSSSRWWWRPPWADGA